MAKVIHTDTPAKRRGKIMRLLSYLVTQSDLSPKSDEDFKDKAAFIYLSLSEIEKTIDETVRPWEKRDYWLKADKFRKDWSWVKKIQSQLLPKIEEGDWKKLSEEINLLKTNLSSTEPAKRLNNREFWKGAYKSLQTLLPK